jgi:hypothetical protein
MGYDTAESMGQRAKSQAFKLPAASASGYGGPRRSDGRRQMAAKARKRLGRLSLARRSEAKIPFAGLPLVANRRR